ncbi:hypothetical protein [Fulvivirga sp.]|uniref:hypothetical protein n=1 Tax=Fulvivirga sp. TaxID=1931237 RepID=UPI0032ECD1E6
MNFKELSEALDTHKIDNERDREITTRILEAERDWDRPITDLDEFIRFLEQEIGGPTTKANLRVLLKRYEANGFINAAWNAESVYALIEIFDYTDSDNLKSIFTDLTKRL